MEYPLPVTLASMATREQPLVSPVAPALAVVMAVLAMRAEALPLMIEERVAASRAGAAPLITEVQVVAAARACATWWGLSAEAPMSCVGCPACPSVTWQSRGLSAPGRRRAGRHFPAVRRYHATSLRVAATQEKDRRARLRRAFPTSSAQRVRVSQILPAGRTPERLGSVDRG